MAKIHDFEARSNKGAEVDFAQFDGSVLSVPKNGTMSSLSRGF